MGAEESLKLAEEHDLSVYMLVREGENFVSKMSGGFDFFVD